MMQIVDVQNPQWADSSKTAINVDVTFAKPALGPMPYTATADDVEPHGKALWAGLNAGDYGVIVDAPAVPLGDLIATKVAELRAACKESIVSGFQSSALGTLHTYPSKNEDQTNLIGAVTASQNPNLSAGWSVDFWCGDSFIPSAWAMRPHTAPQIQKVLEDAVIARSALSAKLDSLCQQAQNAQNATALSAISWTAP